MPLNSIAYSVLQYLEPWESGATFPLTAGLLGEFQLYCIYMLRFCWGEAGGVILRRGQGLLPYPRVPASYKANLPLAFGKDHGNTGWPLALRLMLKQNNSHCNLWRKPCPCKWRCPERNCSPWRAHAGAEFQQELQPLERSPCRRRFSVGNCSHARCT